MSVRVRRFIAAVVLATGVLSAQESSTRAGQIEAAREEKRLHPPEFEKPLIERALIVVKERRLLDKWKYGWHGIKPRIGALVTGSGFAVGPELLRDDIRGGDISFRVTTQFSTGFFQLYDTELAFPRLANEHLFVSLTARHRNYPRMQYYGPGPDSKKTGRSDYRLEDNRFGFTFGVRPVRPLYFGVTGDLLQVNIGPGTQRRWTNTEVQYTEAQAPGIQHQTDFLRGGVFAALDTRDIPGGPKSGTLLRADYVYYNDIDLQRNTHKRLNLQAQQYIPFFNKRRVIALRGKSDLTWKNPGQVVPFYLQPVLGGSDDLRGFRPFRFYDDNLILFNAEYRWEVFAGLDMAIFGDAGKVFHSKHDWNVRNMEGSYGVGMRFNARNAVFMRIDAGFSHEGWQLWLKFNNVF
jgi:outer membrane protein assembly factor BamA